MNLPEPFRPIVVDIEKDKRLVKNCESCGEPNSTWLYLVKNNIFGIFHICQKCKTQLEELEVEEGTGIREFVLKNEPEVEPVENS